LLRNESIGLILFSQVALLLFLLMEFLEKKVLLQKMGYARRSSFPSALCLGCRFVAINFKQSNGTQFDYEANSLYMP
jgi:hypothetical protein